MKNLLLGIVLLSLCGCTTLSKVGEEVCNLEGQLSSGISQVGSFFGAPGNLIAGGIGLALNAGCAAMNVILSAPEDLTNELGITTPEEPFVGPTTVDPTVDS